LAPVETVERRAVIFMAFPARLQPLDLSLRVVVAVAGMAGHQVIQGIKAVQAEALLEDLETEQLVQPILPLHRPVLPNL
jgi:hypothetical protein